MNVKTSAHYQREYRKRLREHGLTKKEIWIRPEHADRASAMEKALRLERPETIRAGPAESPRAPWRAGALFDELHSSELVRSGRASIEIIEGIEPTLLVVMREFGDLPVFLSVAGDQIIAESVLWLQSDVVDCTAFNDTVLRTHKYFPLSTLCLEKRADEDYYLMFGSLSAAASLADIQHEIEVLAGNVINATEAYMGFLKTDEIVDGEVS